MSHVIVPNVQFNKLFVSNHNKIRYLLLEKAVNTYIASSTLNDVKIYAVEVFNNFNYDVRFVIVCDADSSSNKYVGFPCNIIETINRCRRVFLDSYVHALRSSLFEVKSVFTGEKLSLSARENGFFDVYSIVSKQMGNFYMSVSVQFVLTQQSWHSTMTFASIDEQIVYLTHLFNDHLEKTDTSFSLNGAHIFRSIKSMPLYFQKSEGMTIRHTIPILYNTKKKRKNFSLLSPTLLKKVKNESVLQTDISTDSAVNILMKMKQP